MFEIIHEDSDLLVINKPAGLVCHPTKSDAWSSLISRVRLHLGGPGLARRSTEPTPDPSQEGNILCAAAEIGSGPGSHRARPQLINRLDRGALRPARGRQGPAGDVRCNARQGDRRGGEAPHPARLVRAERGVIDAPLGKDENSRVGIKDCVRPDGACSQTEFWAQGRFTRPEGDFTLLRVVPHTGRKHQIRIHLAHRGHPIVGDKLYSGDENLYLDFVKSLLTEEQRRRLILPNQALHARSVQCVWRDRRWNFRAEPEGWFVEFACGQLKAETAASLEPPPINAGNSVVHHFWRFSD